MWIMVDIEADGPIPGDFSMISIGAVVVQPGLEKRFYCTMRPLQQAKWMPEALRVTGFSHDQTLEFLEPKQAMEKFNSWIMNNCKSKRKYFISDNNGFDWQFINWYFWHFLKENPFGHSSTNLGSLYKGMQKNMFKSFKHLRKNKHTHNALDDAVGNAEALLELKLNYNLNIPL